MTDTNPELPQVALVADEGLVPLPAVSDADAEQGGLLTLREAAERVSVTVESVRLWVRRGQVRTVVWEGREWIVERSLYDCERHRRRQRSGRPRKQEPKRSGHED